MRSPRPDWSGGPRWGEWWCRSCVEQPDTQGEEEEREGEGIPEDLTQKNLGPDGCWLCNRGVDSQLHLARWCPAAKEGWGI